MQTFEEECDDGNSLLKDGCSDCKIDALGYCKLIPLDRSECVICPQNCIKCEFNRCIICDVGYALLGNICIPCGKNCNECENDPGFCVPTCGDSIVSLQEECDDGNKISNDGCSWDCKIESGF